MKYVRILLSIISILTSLASGGLAVLFFVAKKKSTLILPNGFAVNFEYIFAAICLIFLVIGYIFLPPLRSKFRTRKTSKAEIKAKLKEHQQKTAVASVTATNSSPSSDDDLDVIQYDDIVLSDDDDPMARLISLGQTDMTVVKLASLIKEFYPDLAHIMNHIETGHANTIDTLAKHILGIARFKIKITDQSLNNDQFANFQQRIFDDEEKEILRMFKPAESAVTDENRKYIGTLVDDRDWEILQRKIRANRSAWISFSIAEADSLLQ